jgi:hypothetical protein
MYSSFGGDMNDSMKDDNYNDARGTMVMKKTPRGGIPATKGEVGGD